MCAIAAQERYSLGKIPKRLRDCLRRIMSRKRAQDHEPDAGMHLSVEEIEPRILLPVSWIGDVLAYRSRVRMPINQAVACRLAETATTAGRRRVQTTHGEDSK